MTRQDDLDRTPETWTSGYLFDTVLTRDTWMHRIDTCRTIDRPPVLTPNHDGALVADVVSEWADRHGAHSPCGSPGRPAATGRWEPAEKNSASTPSFSSAHRPAENLARDYSPFRSRSEPASARMRALISAG
jgi:hypothetical protein